jgi:hypothetical protein
VRESVGEEIAFLLCTDLFAVGHPAGYGTFEIMKIVTEKKGVPNFENVHKVRVQR